MSHPERQRQAHHGVDLVDVAQWREHAVEQVAHGPVDEGTQERRTGSGEAEQSEHRGGQQRTTQRHGVVAQAHHPHGRHQAGGQDEHRNGGELVGRGPPGLVADGEVGQPVLRAADAVGPPGRGGGRIGGLDEVQERRAVPAEQEEGHQPPGTAGRHADQPPSGEPASGSLADLRKDHEGEQRDDARHLGGVDPAHAEHGDAAPQTRLAGSETPSLSEHQREQGPGQQGSGNDLACQHPDRAQQTGRQRVRQAGEHPGPCTHAESAGDVPRAFVGDHEQQGRPESLHDPVGQAGDLTEHEERTVGKEVTVGLVLQLAERGVRVPQVQGATEEPGGIARQVQLGVPRGSPGLLEETPGQEQQPHQPAAGEPRPSADGSSSVVPASKVQRECSQPTPFGGFP